jgi:membrane fusion protein (multidrug efflux system)
VARVDDRDFKVALDRPKADVATTLPSATSTRIAQQRSAIDRERPRSPSARPRCPRQTDHVRYGNLKKSGYGTVQRAETEPPCARNRAAPEGRAGA